MMADQQTNIALLRKSNIPEWILVDEDWKKFISFFKEYISGSNVMTDEELIELDLWEQQNKRNNTVGLIERMDKVAKKHEGIWLVTENNITVLEKAIDIHSQNDELFDDLILKTGTLNLNVIEKSTTLKSEKSKLLSKEQSVTDECLKMVEEFQDIRLTNERKIGEIGQLYLKSAQNPLFMHQMPINDYFRQLEQFNDNAKHFIRKNFKVQNSIRNTTISTDVEKQQNKEFVLNDLRVVADRLLNAYNKLHLSKMNFNAKTTLTNQFKIQNWSPSTLMGMRRDLLQMEHDNELNEGQKQHLLHKLKEQALEMSQLDVDALVYESNQKRMKRAKQRLDYLSRFACLISEIMFLSEIFWVLVQLDMERMKCRNTYDTKLDTYRMDLLTCNRRIEILNMIRKHSNGTLIQNYYKHLMEHLLVSQPDGEYFRMVDTIKCSLSIDELKSIISKVVQNTGKYHSPTFGNGEFFMKASCIEELIRMFVYDGPVMKPQKSIEWYREKKISLERELMLIYTRNELKKEECGHYIKKWSIDKFWRHMQVLWVWFMTEPKKVIKALKLIGGEAQQRSKNAAVTSRHTVGIVRKK